MNVFLPIINHEYILFAEMWFFLVCDLQQNDYFFRLCFFVFSFILFRFDKITCSRREQFNTNEHITARIRFECEIFFFFFFFLVPYSFLYNGFVVLGGGNAWTLKYMCKYMWHENSISLALLPMEGKNIETTKPAAIYKCWSKEWEVLTCNL